MFDHTEAGLLDRLLERDETALREAIREHGPAVYGMARRVAKDPSAADEIAQDTFVALWRRPGAFDPDRGTLRVFLLGVARNKAIDLVRREERLRKTKDALIAEVQSIRGPQIEYVDKSEEVRAALANLSHVQKEALVLAYFGGRTYREVAQELGIPEGTAKTRLRDGLIQLRKVMSSREERN